MEQVQDYRLDPPPFKPKVVYICDIGGDKICDGDDYYLLPNGMKVCEDCMRKALRTAYALMEDW